MNITNIFSIPGTMRFDTEAWVYKNSLDADHKVLFEQIHFEEFHKRHLSPSSSLESAIKVDKGRLSFDKRLLIVLDALIYKIATISLSIFRMIGGFSCLSYDSGKFHAFYIAREVLDLGAKIWMLGDVEKGLQFLAWNALCLKQMEINYTSDNANTLEVYQEGYHAGSSGVNPIEANKEFLNKIRAMPHAVFYHYLSKLEGSSDQKSVYQLFFESLRDNVKINALRLDILNQVDQKLKPVHPHYSKGSYTEKRDSILNENATLYHNLQIIDPSYISNEGWETLWKVRLLQITRDGSCDELSDHLCKVLIGKLGGTEDDSDIDRNLVYLLSGYLSNQFPEDCGEQPFQDRSDNQLVEVIHNTSKKKVYVTAPEYLLAKKLRSLVNCDLSAIEQKFDPNNLSKHEAAMLTAHKKFLENLQKNLLNGIKPDQLSEVTRSDIEWEPLVNYEDTFDVDVNWGDSEVHFGSSDKGYDDENSTPKHTPLNSNYKGTGFNIYTDDEVD